jgi:Flp pilus assembly protein CpaB
VRSRALPLLLALVAALTVGIGVAATADSGNRPVPPSATPAARADAVDAPGTGAVAPIRDPFAHERDGHRGDIATVMAALVLAAGAAGWMARSRSARTTMGRRALRARPRGPPRLPAPVSI